MVVQVDAGAGAEGTPAAALRAEAAQNDDMGGAELLLGLCGAPVARARATPAAANVTAGASAEEEEEMVPRWRTPFTQRHIRDHMFYQ